MITSKTITPCPICGTAMPHNEFFCHTCGWIRNVFPSVVPTVLKQQEEERIRIMQEMYRKSQEFDAIKNKLTIITQQVNASQKVIQEKGEELSMAKEQQKNAEDIINKAKQKIETLEKAVQETNVKLRIANKKLTDVEQQYRKQITELHDSTKRSILKGIVSIKNRNTEALCYIPVFEGRNTFGSAIDDNQHHQIKMRIRGITLLPHHFEINANNDKLVLHDLSNGTLTCNCLPISPNGMYVDGNAMILIENILEIHISKV